MKIRILHIFFRQGSVEWDSCLRWWMAWCAREQDAMRRSGMGIGPGEATFQGQSFSFKNAVILRRPVAWLREQRQ